MPRQVYNNKIDLFVVGSVSCRSISYVFSANKPRRKWNNKHSTLIGSMKIVYFRLNGITEKALNVDYKLQWKRSFNSLHFAMPVLRVCRLYMTLFLFCKLRKFLFFLSIAFFCFVHFTRQFHFRFDNKIDGLTWHDITFRCLCLDKFERFVFILFCTHLYLYRFVSVLFSRLQCVWRKWKT